MVNPIEKILLPVSQTFRLLRWQQRVTNVEVMTGNGKAIPMLGQGDHWHYHRASELTSIHSGAGTRLVADHIELFEPNDLIFIGSNVPHYWHFSGASSGLAIQWDLPLEHGIWNFVEASSLKTLFEFSKRGLRIKGKTAISIRNQMKGLVSLTGLFRLASFLSIMAEIIEAPKKDIIPISSRSFSLSGSGAHHDAMRRTVSYLLANYREQIILKDLLELTNMSRATFARQFQLHAGKSFSSFHNQVRLQAVCKDLVSTSDFVSNIAFNHGFNQLSFFNRLFRRELNKSPSEFRKMNQKAPSLGQR